MKPLRVTFIFLLLAVMTFAQQETKYASVDKFVKSYPKKINSQQDLDKLIDAVNKNFTSPADKVRAAFFWISENIGYDSKAANDNISPVRNDITSLIQSGEALCSGYSTLMEYFCKKLNVECVTIHGSGRSLYTDIVLNPAKLIADHSWNAVKINGQWRLIDATWGSGYTDYATGQYRKSRNDKFFLADPQNFVYKHFPLKPEWQLLDTPVTAQAFCSWPFIDEGFYTNQLSKVYPFQLFIDKKVGDTVQFHFTTEKELNYISLNSLDNVVTETGSLSKKGNTYSYIFKPKKTGEYDLRVSVFYLDMHQGSGAVVFSPALIYRLRVKSK